MHRRAALGLIAYILARVRLTAQVPAYDFYPEFRRWWFALSAEQRMRATNPGQARAAHRAGVSAATSDTFF